MALSKADINLIYQELLARTATDAEQTTWAALDQTQGDDAVKAQIEKIPEVTNLVDPVIRLYQGAFGRVPDTADPNGNFLTGAQSGFWVNVNALRNGASLDALAEAFVASAEFTALYGSTAVTPALIAAYYQHVLGRLASSSEINGWVNSHLDAAHILLGFTQSAEFIANSQPAVDAFKLALENGQHPNGDLANALPPAPPEFTLDASAASIDEGQTVTFTLQGAATDAGKSYAYTISGVQAGDVNVPLSGTVTLDAQGVAFLTVAATADNVTEGLEAMTLQVAGLASTVVINDTSTTPLNLGQGTDNLVGTDGNDNFSADVVQTAFLPIQTLNNTDQIDGGAGRDTLSVQLVNPFTVPALLKSIEVLNVDGAPGFIVPPVTLDVVNADSIDSINFRAPSNNVTINNVRTVLTEVGISDQGGGLTDTINHTGTQLNPAGQALSINLTDVGQGAGVVTLQLNGTGGYDQLNVHSNGSIANQLHVGGTAQDATKVTVDGAANLAINDSNGSAWNLATLNNFDGSAATGMLSSHFTGAAAVATTVSGGNNNDTFTFANTATPPSGALVTVNGNGGDDTILFGQRGAANLFDSSPAILNGGDGNDFINVFAGLGNVTVHGGANDDVIRWQSNNGNAFGFGGDVSVVDGGTGHDVLQIEIQTSGDQLLTAGAGARITNTEVIQHVADVGNGSIALNVDMSQDGTQDDGSASLVELVNNGLGNAGAYTTVTVTNLANNQTIQISDNIANDLELGHTNVVNDIYHINLNGGVTVGALDTVNNAPANAADEIDINSIGGNGPNVVHNVNDTKIDGDLMITGNTALTLGDTGAYGVDGGVINASGMTAGGLNLFVNAVNLQVTGSQANDTFHLVAGQDNSAFDLSTGGADTVEFHQFSNDGTFALNLGSGVFNQVLGFDGNDNLRFDISDLALETGDDATAGTAVISQTMARNAVIDIDNTNTNLLVFTNAFTGGANTSAQAAFDNVIGGGIIIVDNGTDNVLGTYYDATNHQAVLFAVDADSAGSASQIEAGDDVTVVGVVSMDQATFNALAGHISLQA